MAELAETIDSDDVVDLLTRLADKSLVVVDESGTRFRLMEMVRGYASERLKETGESEQLKGRHFTWTCDFANDAGAKLAGPEMQQWLDRLDLEHDNIRRALSHNGDIDGRLCLASDMYRFWFIRGFLTEGREWLESLLQLDHAVDPSLYARGLNCAGALAWRKGDLTAARSGFEKSLELRLAAGDKSGGAAALNNLGLVADDEGDLFEARGYFERSAAVYREIADRAGLCMVLANLGSNLIEQGKLDEATTASQEFLMLAKETQDPWCLAAAWHNLAEIESRQGETADARQFGQLALEQWAKLGDGAQIVQMLILFAEIAIAEGWSERGAQLLAAAESRRLAEGLKFRGQETEAFSRAKDLAQELLSHDDFGECWQRGAYLSNEEAIALALEG